MTHRLTQRLANLIQSDTVLGAILCLMGPPLMWIDVYGGAFVLTLGLIVIIVERLKVRSSSDRPQKTAPCNRPLTLATQCQTPARHAACMLLPAAASVAPCSAVPSSTAIAACTRRGPCRHARRQPSTTNASLPLRHAPCIGPPALSKARAVARPRERSTSTPAPLLGTRRRPHCRRLILLLLLCC
jgi:hypothetical protein